MHYADFPRISFGIIVLNGEPFTKYCLRQLYPHAYEIIVVEGGSRKAIDEAPEGHSTDGTLEALYEFKAQEDPEDKIQIITRDDFWTEKDEQSQAYAQVATGDHLWQVDIDESNPAALPDAEVFARNPSRARHHRSTAAGAC